MHKPRKPKPKKKKKAETPEDDRALWRAVTQTVEPLKEHDLAAEQFGALGPEDAPPVKPRPAASPSSPLKPPPKPAPSPPAALPELTHDAQPGLDGATAKRMRRGQVKIEGRIDLHGMTQAEAHRALDAFLDAAQGAGKRDVLVITGKGTRADGSIGVLRQEVPRWLNGPANRARVVAFHYAAPKDGGEGALYVRLKKRI